MHKIIQAQREYFNSGETKSHSFRVKQLKTLQNAIKAHEVNLLSALKADLNKGELEAFATEIGVTCAEIGMYVKNLSKWMRPKREKTPLFFMPGKSRVHFEPYGCTLIIAPWNYPVKNMLGPLIGAISAGNCMVLKPSELAPHTSKAIALMIKDFFDPKYIAVVEGGIPETTELLQEKFDYILFTGGTEVGRIIYQQAAKQLTPVTLELGGKSPTIIDKNTNLNVTAKRLVWGKFVNAGQTCIAPDYVFVHQDIKENLLNKIKANIVEFYGKNPSKSADFGRIITDRHFERISKLLEGDIVHGGETDATNKYIAPTVIDNVTPQSKVMQEEIFGPIMPIMTFTDVQQVIDYINQGEKPLAMYIFSNSTSFAERIINNTSSGGVCVNETFMHAGNANLPFGGVGNSGMGAYNGKYGFETFSHKRAVLTRSFLFDVQQKYAPFTPGKLKFIRMAIDKLL